MLLVRGPDALDGLPLKINVCMQLAEATRLMLLIGAKPVCQHCDSLARSRPER